MGAQGRGCCACGMAGVASGSPSGSRGVGVACRTRRRGPLAIMSDHLALLRVAAQPLQLRWLQEAAAWRGRRDQGDDRCAVGPQRRCTFAPARPPRGARTQTRTHARSHTLFLAFLILLSPSPTPSPPAPPAHRVKGPSTSCPALDPPSFPQPGPLPSPSPPLRGRPVHVRHLNPHSTPLHLPHRVKGSSNEATSFSMAAYVCSRVSMGSFLRYASRT